MRIKNCWHCGNDYTDDRVHLCTHPLAEEKYGRSFTEQIRAENEAVLDEVYDDVPEPRATTLPTDSAERKGVPLHAGVMRYFPAALAAVARVSKSGNDKHNGKGSPLQHTRGLSMDHADCILRHLMDMEEQPIDPISGLPEVFNVAWRALALCQEWCENNEGAPLAPGASNDS